jgi:endonuclease/exonuclease/phosphatase family metal-dependent hydrolase
MFDEKEERVMRVRVGTFNLFQYSKPPYAYYRKKARFSSLQWQEKEGWIVAQLQKMRCDIVGFQEVFSADALASLVKSVGLEYFATVEEAKVSERDSLKYVTTTVALASKYPIISLSTPSLSLEAMKRYGVEERLWGFARQPICATLLLPSGEEIVVYVAHLKSNRLNQFEPLFHAEHTFKEKEERVMKRLEGGGGSALRQRVCEASSLRHAIEQNKERMTLLLCDLNDTCHSFTYTLLSSEKQKEERFEDSFCVAHKRMIPREPTHYFMGKGQVLDYLFFNEGALKKRDIEVCRYEVFGEHLQKRKSSLLQSDHAQVVVTLRFKA